jgi:hypothetical protein
VEDSGIISTTVFAILHQQLFTPLKFFYQKSDNNDNNLIKKCILMMDMTSYRFDKTYLEKRSMAGFLGDLIHHKISAVTLLYQGGELNLRLVPVNLIMRS